MTKTKASIFEFASILLRVSCSFSLENCIATHLLHKILHTYRNLPLSNPVVLQPLRMLRCFQSGFLPCWRANTFGRFGPMAGPFGRPSKALELINWNGVSTTSDHQWGVGHSRFMLISSPNTHTYTPLAIPFRQSNQWPSNCAQFNSIVCQFDSTTGARRARSTELATTEAN